MVLGTTEIIIIILLIILLIFGPKKIPQLARAIGKSVREYKKGLHEGEKPKKKKKLKG